MKSASHPNDEPLSGRVRERASRLAPAVRMLLAEEKPGAVAFGASSVAAERDALVVPGEEDIEEQYLLLEKEIAAHRKARGSAPHAVVVEGLGVFSKTAGARPGPGRLAGKIALVTGAAQGFGWGIACGLAEEGALVVSADLNAEAAEMRAEELRGRFGTGLAVGVDVTDERSVEAMVRSVVLAYGGLDLLVSNAGVLKAGGLDETSADDFEFVNRVNYRGYFLCAKHASAVMKLQHRFRPELFFDIVQINSKSGLAGSSRNFAYAGSKFAGIGLTQSFALELVSHRIKVNAVCPGNFFEGPLWSDPEKGLFVQYLGAGKVPGAKTAEDVKRFYEAKVPMGRGCEVRDVVRAVLYLAEQEYETGQALPVTGGQTMLA